MAAILANIMSCSLGTDEFQVTDLSWKEEPILKNGYQAGKNVSAKIEGWVDNENLAAFVASARECGKDVIVKGVAGAVLYSLPAAMCVAGGPYVTVEQTAMKGTTAGSVNIVLNLTGTTVADPAKDDKSGGNPTTVTAPSNEISYSIRPDLLTDVTISGEASGPNAAAAVAAVLVSARSTYPWPNYVVKTTQKMTGTGDKREFNISVESMATSLPEGGGTCAVDGTYSFSLAVDNEGMRTVTVAYDLVCDGDPMALEAVLRSYLDGKYIVTSTVETSGYKEQRLRCSYVCLSTDFLGRVLTWTQTVEVEGGEDPTARVVEYEGVGVVLVYNQAKGQARAFKQSGSAMGIRAYPTPPATMAPDGYVLSERPRVRYEQVDAWRHRTTWDYAYVGTGSIGAPAVAAILAQLFRPGDPNFTPAVNAGGI